jgi:hypothetical protein
VPVDWNELVELDTEGRQAKALEVEEALTNKMKELGINIDHQSILAMQMQVMAEQLWPDVTDRLMFDIDVNSRLLDAIEAQRLAILEAKLGMQNGHVNRVDLALRRQAKRERRQGLG